MKKNYKADTTNAYTCFGIDIVSKNAENSGKPKVYTSFYAMYDFTKTIGGDDMRSNKHSTDRNRAARF